MQAKGTTVFEGRSYEWSTSAGDFDVEVVVVCGGRRYVQSFESGCLHDVKGRLDDGAAEAIARDVEKALGGAS